MILRCDNCGSEFEKPIGEYNRRIRLGYTKFYCSRSCGAYAASSPKRCAIIKKVCPVCQNSFETKEDRHEATFCSRSCASKGSVTEYRRLRSIEVGKRAFSKENHLWMVAAGLRAREWSKYKKLHELLHSEDIQHEFEHPIQGLGVFDLLIVSISLLIEFDSDYHKSPGQAKKDEKKTSGAMQLNFEVERFSDPFDTNEVFQFIIKRLSQGK